jgi:hypothetical protein
MSLTRFKCLDIHSYKSVDHRSKLSFQFKQINSISLKTKGNREDYG